MRLYRIASSRHPVWDGTGAAILGGRWNSPGRPVIYAAMTYAGAMLEVLAHTNTGRVPPSHRCVIADVSADISLTRYSASELPTGWDAQDTEVGRSLGDAWLDAGKSALLVVPSVVARLESNVLVNPAHPDSGRIRVSEPMEVQWDRRLFTR